MPTQKSDNFRSANVIADHFLLKVNSSAGDTLSNLKLQKLCYFAQAASLAHLNHTLFDDDIEAWAHGPVVPKLYRRFRKYAWQAIDPFDLRVPHKHKLSTGEMLIVDKIWEKLSPHSAKMLEEMSHKDKPWKDNYKPLDGKVGGRCNNVITPQKIKSFYTSDEKPTWFKKIAFS